MYKGLVMPLIGWQEYEGLNDTLLWVENINKVSPYQFR